MSPDQVCEKYYEMRVKVSISVRDDFVFIEGDKTDLEFLGHLFLAQSTYDDDDGFHISPTGAGNGLFNKKSSHGIHIYRIEKK